MIYILLIVGSTFSRHSLSWHRNCYSLPRLFMWYARSACSTVLQCAICMRCKSVARIPPLSKCAHVSAWEGGRIEVNLFTVNTTGGGKHSAHVYLQRLPHAIADSVASHEWCTMHICRSTLHGAELCALWPHTLSPLRRVWGAESADHAPVGNAGQDSLQTMRF